MRVLCIADNFIPEDYMKDGLTELLPHIDAIVYRTWSHPSIPELQNDNLLIEQGGPGAVPTPEELFTDIEDFDVVITQFCPIPSHIISKATRLRIIGVLRGGVENIAIQAAKERGIHVINTPGRNAEAVAEL